MHKQPITYVDFNGTERTEDFYFHLSTPEVVRLEAEVGTSLEDHTKTLAQNGEAQPLLQFLEKVILMSYGVKSTDGRSFKKSPEIRQEFEYSQAYAEFFEQIIKDPSLARKFAEGIVDNGKARKNTVAPTVVQN